MKRPAAALFFVLALLLAGCTATTDRGPRTPAPGPTSSSSEAKRPSTGQPTSESTGPGPTPEPANEVPEPSETTRTPPTAGYQCLEGDEKIYDVCAGHKAWTEGQIEYAECIDSGGVWDVPSQTCEHPPNADAPSTEEPSTDAENPSDPSFRDSNGETYEEYCARTGQPLESCAAG